MGSRRVRRSAPLRPYCPVVAASYPVLVSSETDPDRLRALGGLSVGSLPAVTVPPSATSGPDGSDALIVDRAALSPELEDWLERVARSGASVLRLVAPCAPSVFPDAEWFLQVTDAGRPWASRLPQEWPVSASWSPLVPGPDEEVLAVVSVGFSDRPVLCRRALGAGQVVTCALGDTASLRSPELRRLLSRLLRARRSSDRRLGIAVVGYGPLGGMGFHHGLGATTTEGLELVAVADTSVERLKTAEAELPGVSTYDDLDLLAADGEVDVVVVATPPSTHPELVEVFLRAGKHVVCEKPLCFTPAQADHLIELAASAGVVLTVHQNRRWDPDFLAARSLVESGRLGDLFNMETFVGGFEHPCRAWHSEVSISGGAIYDWGAHYLDWTLLLMGDDPVRVTAAGHKRVWHDVTNEDQVRVRLTWSDGREAEFVHSDVAAVRRPKLYLQGTRGTLVGHYRPLVTESIVPGIGYRRLVAHHAEAPAELSLASYTGSAGIAEERVPLPAPAEFPFHANLADHLLLGEPLAVPVESVRNVIAVLDAAQRSLGAGGRAVELGGSA